MFFVSKTPSLSLKILLPLVFFQTLSSILGVSLMMQHFQNMRFKELDRLLDQQMETLETAIVEQNHAFAFKRDNELLLDIFNDPNIFALLIDAKGRVNDLTLGPNQYTQKALQTLLIPLVSEREELSTILVGSDRWRVAQEKVRLGSRYHQATLMVATNLEPSLSDLKNLKMMMLVGASCLLLINILGTIFLVNLSTRNLRYLATSLRSLTPQNLEWEPPSQPLSAEEKLLSDNFESMLGKLRANQEAQKLFLAYASHELKTPVATLLTTLEVLISRRREVAEYESKARILLKTVKGLHVLTNKILDITRLDIGDQVQWTQLDVVQWLQERGEPWQLLARDYGIQWNILFLNTSKIILRSDPQLLAIVMDNLLENAFKYSPQNSEVILRISGPPLCLEIIDRGRGMGPEDLKRLGEIFFRGDDARHDPGSYGLGFAYAMRIIKKLGGEIRVMSKLGEGTTVSLVWSESENLRDG